MYKLVVTYITFVSIIFLFASVSMAFYYCGLVCVVFMCVHFLLVARFIALIGIVEITVIVVASEWKKKKCILTTLLSFLFYGDTNSFWRGNVTNVTSQHELQFTQTTVLN